MATNTDARPVFQDRRAVRAGNLAGVPPGRPGPVLLRQRSLCPTSHTSERRSGTGYL